LSKPPKPAGIGGFLHFHLLKRKTGPHRRDKTGPKRLPHIIRENRQQVVEFLDRKRLASPLIEMPGPSSPIVGLPTHLAGLIQPQLTCGRLGVPKPTYSVNLTQLSGGLPKNRRIRPIDIFSYSAWPVHPMKYRESIQIEPALAAGSQRGQSMLAS
jgi:hypothetical protein